MYHKRYSDQTSRSTRSTPRNKNITSSQSYAPLSSVVQRAQQDPNKVSGDEWEQLNSAIGTNATGEVLTGEQWVPEFKGISGQLWGGAAIQMKSIDDNKYSQVEQENKTGLPEKLKAGIENFSGIPMDDVRVHYNSSQPRKYDAHAYTQGIEIYVAPGQEKYLPHESWHIVQQKQGRVTARRYKNGVGFNDDESLEKEADEMSAKAIGCSSGFMVNEQVSPIANIKMPTTEGGGNQSPIKGTIQRVIHYKGEDQHKLTLYKDMVLMHATKMRNLENFATGGVDWKWPGAKQLGRGFYTTYGEPYKDDSSATHVIYYKLKGSLQGQVVTKEAADKHDDLVKNPQEIEDIGTKEINNWWAGNDFLLTSGEEPFHMWGKQKVPSQIVLRERGVQVLDQANAMVAPLGELDNKKKLSTYKQKTDTSSGRAAFLADLEKKI